jgi:hypothetical protein
LLRHVTRINRNRIPKIMLKFRPNGRIRLWTPLKILLDEAATVLSRLNTWRMILVSITGIIRSKLHVRTKLSNLRPALYVLMQQALMFSTHHSQKVLAEQWTRSAWTFETHSVENQLNWCKVRNVDLLLLLFIIIIIIVIILWDILRQRDDLSFCSFTNDLSLFSVSSRRSLAPFAMLICDL